MHELNNIQTHDALILYVSNNVPNIYISVTNVDTEVSQFT